MWGPDPIGVPLPNSPAIDFKCECGDKRCRRHIIIAAKDWDYWCGTGAIIHIAHRTAQMAFIERIGNFAMVVEWPSKGVVA